MAYVMAGWKILPSSLVNISRSAAVLPGDHAGHPYDEAGGQRAGAEYRAPTGPTVQLHERVRVLVDSRRAQSGEQRVVVPAGRDQDALDREQRPL